MAKQKFLTKEEIIPALSVLNEETLMEVLKAGAEEVERRDKALEKEIEEKEAKRAIIKNGGK